MPRALAMACWFAVIVAVLAAAEPRLRPVAATAFTDEQRALSATHSGAFGTGADFRTLLVHPELVKGVLPFANYILSESTLPPRHRQLLMLRTAWLTRSDYLWAKHATLASAAGLSAQDIVKVAVRNSLSKTDSFEDTLLRAAEEL